MNADHETVHALYQRYDYLRAYSEHTNLRIKDCPKKAVGGRWEEMGHLQLRFLLDQGLEPTYTLLDFGCGTLRAGRLLIEYLESSKYFGVDISVGAIDYAHQFTNSEGLSQKKPTIRLSHCPENLSIDLNMCSFDIILAQSVFTHLDSENVERIVRSLRKLCSDGSRFFLYILSWKHSQKIIAKNFEHPQKFYETLADRYGFSFRDLSPQYKHPYGQRMIEYSVA